MPNAIYGGSFDPPTNGHINIIEQALGLFDKVHVIIATNSQKAGTFDREKRQEILGEIYRGHERVIVETLDGKFIARYAQEIGATVLIRGIRSAADFDYETALAQGNKKINPNLTTVFLAPPPELACISSTFAKSYPGNTGWEEEIRCYLPESSYYAMLEHYRGYPDLAFDWGQYVSAMLNDRGLYNELIRRYTEPHRHYHGIRHIRHCLEEFYNMNMSYAEKPVIDRRELVAAILFHDIVYDPRQTNGENERQSQEIFRRLVLPRFLADNANSIYRICQAIEMTIKHELSDPSNKVAAILLDIDHSGLGQPWEQFEFDRQNIRKEYDFVPEHIFRVESAKILGDFLKRERIYYTEYFHEKYEQQARENLTRAIQKLTN